MIFLRDQVALDVLAGELREAGADRASRHARVITELRDLAARTQGDLLDVLVAEQGRGRVLGYTPHWLVNGIVVVATPAALAALAGHPDVDVIEPDLVVELIAPVAEADLPAAKAGRGIGITPGVVGVGARRVWDELGIRGEGALIGTLDTGVQGSHPALASRWRGLSTPWQHAWLDLVGGGTQFPTDFNSHGTHVTGTIAGLAADDTIGVAPAAEWIACNAIDQGANSGFDNDILAALAWFADPDGDPATVDDVPDVVQNSWGVNQNFSGYFECDSRWWGAIDACEAAGVVLTWSAGNEGPSSQTLRSPADRATTLFNCFSVGSTIATPPYTISSFSSRGPAGPDCGPAENRVKPEIAAPGSEIYSAVPGGYGYKSGTSMAGPHLAGVVALMRSANPDLEVDTIKQVLLETANDLGDPGEDNTYGHGFVDAYEAVLTVMDGVGYLEGTVVAADTGQPIAGALVDLVGSPRSATADAAGEFRLILQEGTHELEISAFGFAVGSAVVTILADETVYETFSLTRLPAATISGTVLDPDGLPAADAAVTAVGTPLPPAIADADGHYSLLLPVGETYTVRALLVGVGIAVAEVALTGDVVLDLQMEPLVQDSFETGDFGTFPWAFGGDAPWVIDTAESYHGDHGARGGPIGHDQSTTLRIAFDVAVAGELSFFYSVSSEANYDYLEFWVDGTRLARWSGTVPWNEYTLALEPGSHVIAWTYDKDGSVSNGADTGWIDLVTFPLLAERPSVVVSPASLGVTVAPDATASEVLTIANVGEAPLTYRLSAQDAATRQVPPQRPVAAAGKEVDVRGGGQAPARGQGGPDTFGYRWLDSDEPGGPLYQWIEIAGTGTPLPDTDDWVFGPFPLGFTFNYYGVEYDEVRICTNGFLTLSSSTLAVYFNRPIPDTAAPDALIAPFWDDLNPAAAGTIYHLADATFERFVVQWEGVARYGAPGDRQTFQVILTPDGGIRFQYSVLSDTESCTVGIENADGTDGLEVLYNAGGYLHDELAILMTTGAAIPWLAYSPGQGSVPGGESLDVAVDFDATGLEPGEYGCELVIATNDPAQSVVIVPVTMVVASTVGAPDGAAATPPAFALHGAAPNPFNPATVLRFSLPVAGHAALQVYDVQGRLVRTLVDGHRAAGPGEVRWDGRDQAGRRVASGTYYARLRAAGQTSVRSLVMVK